jgi:hypothetical protein
MSMANAGHLPWPKLDFAVRGDSDFPIRVGVDSIGLAQRHREVGLREAGTPDGTSVAPAAASKFTDSSLILIEVTCAGVTELPSVRHARHC